MGFCLLEGGGKDDEGEISYLIFADDTLVFCGFDEDQMDHLCWILMWFEAQSGLEVNMEKVKSSWLVGWTIFF